jgi:acyl-CoA thioesterase
MTQAGPAARADGAARDDAFAGVAPNGAGAFARQMAAIAPGTDGTPGRYRAEVDRGWNCPVVPQGGLMAAVAAHAMAVELGVPDHALRSLTTVFATAVPAGPVTIDVDVLRRGRSLSQASATVRAEGASAGHTTVAVFGGTRPGFRLSDRQPPDVPPAEACPSFGEGYDGPDQPDVPFWDRVEGRPCLGHAPWDDYVPERSDCAYWYRFQEPPRRADGTLDPLALVTLCDTMPGSIGERMGPSDATSWWAPSADLTVHVLGESRSEWLLAHLRAHRAADGYASGELALWDPQGGLVAFATQVMVFTFDEVPAPELLVPLDERRGA